MQIEKSTKNKILIIRFSSIGDVIQSLSIPSKLIEGFPKSEIHWLTRSDLAPILEGHPHIHQIHRLDRRGGVAGLLKRAWELRSEHFTHIYDAHNNLRSRTLTLILRLGRLGIFPGTLRPPLLLRRSVKRWKRFLLFRFRKNTFEMPFSGQRDLLEPLVSWGLTKTLPRAPQFFPSKDELLEAQQIVPWKNYIALAPSAAYFLKRWPKDYWIQLIQSMTHENFVLLGGPQDSFLEDIHALAPQRILNLAGKTGLRKSAAVIACSQVLVSNDTGMLHFAEQLGHPCIALMGPAPFGFPSRSSTGIMEINLNCRPCSKHGQGPCKNKRTYHQCLVDISPSLVHNKLKQLLALTPNSRIHTLRGSE